MENGSPPKRRGLIKSPPRPSPLRRPLNCIAEQRSKATRSSNAKTDEKSKPKPPPKSRAKNQKSKDAKPIKTKSAPHPEPETPSSSKAQTEIAPQNTSNQNESCSQNKIETAPQNEPTESPQAPETTSQAPPSAESKNTKTSVPEVFQCNVPSKSPNINAAILCEEHLSCPPVPWTVMGEKLKHVRRAIN